MYTADGLQHLPNKNIIHVFTLHRPQSTQPLMSKERIYFHIRDGNERCTLTNRMSWSPRIPFQAQPSGLPTSVEARKRGAGSFEGLDLIRQYASHPRSLSILPRGTHLSP
jgi:hypothetical protein